MPQQLVVTGGGTGGHVFPALEVALRARDDGWIIRYLGSERGQEKSACEKAMVPFSAFPSGPVGKPWTPRGAQSLLQLLKATNLAVQAMRADRPDVVFATGGYAAAPVLNAARKLGIPIVLHEQNAVPGRTIRLMAGSARAVCTVFHAAQEHFPGSKVHRTGMPIRQALRDSAQGRLLLGTPPDSTAPIVTVMGGSQGSAALNDIALATAVRMAKSEVQWLHITGLSHFESTMHSLRKLAVKSEYHIKAYLEADEMAAALFNSELAVCRSGAGTVSELAAFRKPAIFVPYPHSFAQHQLKNAQELANLGAADVVEQANLDPATLEGRILAWVTDRDRQKEAAARLADWDVPDALDRIMGIIKQAASPHAHES